MRLLHLQYSLWQLVPESRAIAKMTARCALYIGALKIYESPWVLPRLLFPKFLMGVLLRSILWMCVQNLKFAALPIPEIIGNTQKIWAVPGYAHTPFSPKFFTGLCSDGPCECIGQICSPYIALLVPRDNGDCSFGLGLRTPNLGQGEAIGGRG